MRQNPKLHRGELGTQYQSEKLKFEGPVEAEPRAYFNR